MLNVMFIQPDLERPSKSPRPRNDIVPTLPAFIVAVNSTREEVESAVLVAAFATGSNANVSPQQRTRAVAQRPRQSRERTRRMVIRVRDRPPFGGFLSLDRGELGTPALRVLSKARCTAGRSLLPEPRCGLLEGRDRAGHDVLALEQLQPVCERPSPEDRGELPGQLLLILVVVTSGELWAADQLAQAPPELRLDRRDRQETP